MSQEKRKALRSEGKKTLAEELPHLPLGFNDIVSSAPSIFSWRLLVPRHPPPIRELTPTLDGEKRCGTNL